MAEQADLTRTPAPTGLLAPQGGTTIEGLGTVHPDEKTHNIITDNLLQINKDTVDKLADLGL